MADTSITGALFQAGRRNNLGRFRTEKNAAHEKKCDSRFGGRSELN
jgi:hypothetical protein